MSKHVFPWWMGYLLINSFRRIVQNPEKLLKPYIAEGMTVLDIGCGMGYFSLPMARMVGESGKVICVDLQTRMINPLVKRAEQAGLLGRIETRVCPNNTLNIAEYNGKFDFVLAFGVVHEVPDSSVLFTEIYELLKPQGKLLIAEPLHVSKNEFNETINRAESMDLLVTQKPKIKKTRAALCTKTDLKRVAASTLFTFYFHALLYGGVGA